MKTKINALLTTKDETFEQYLINKLPQLIDLPQESLEKIARECSQKLHTDVYTNIMEYLIGEEYTGTRESGQPCKVISIKATKVLIIIYHALILI